MKTLVVLSFVVGLAIAAPASQENSIAKGIASNYSGLIKREKKSPQLQDAIPSSPEGVSGFDTLPADFNADVESPTASARSFGLKGPIIVKKKSGYHIYRDSEEERAAADSQETCGKQMRVKVCDAHKSGKSADLADQNTEISNNDVESSIMVAKEAIDSLQKDMQKLEQTGHWKHGKSEVDTSMHHNIETVRHALQNVQGRIGKLESMNLRATTLKDAKVLDDITKGKSEEDRLAQWKEAMENIQKNVEVARNIEDSFKSSDDLLLPEAVDTTKFMNNADQDLKNHEMSAKSSSTNLLSKNAVKDETDKNIDVDHHKPLEKSTSDSKNDEQEMTVAASEPIESTIKHNAMVEEKSTDISIDTQSNGLDSKLKPEEKKDRDADKDSLLSINKEDKIHESKNNELNKETSFRVSENKHHNLDPTDNEHAQKDSAGNKDIKKVSESNKSGHLSQEKNAWEESQPEDTFMKAADPTDMSKEATNELKGEHERASFNDVEKMASHLDIHNEALKLEKPESQMKHSDSSLISTHNQGMRIPEHEIKMPGHGMHMTGHDMHKGGNDMSLVGHEMKMHGHGMQMADSHMHKGKHDMFMPGHGMHMQGQDMYMQGHDMHMQGHGMQMPRHGMHMTNNPGHGMKHGKQGKSSEFDNTMQPSIQMTMREAAGKSAMDNLFQWKHHDSARAAYGGGYSAGGLNLAGAGGSEALGIFPNAKVGGCGIPLLLSCSPSVVQGSLAKSHSSYAAPAYRTEDDFGLKKKRDVIKTKDLTNEKAKPKATKKNIEILETMN